MKHRINTTMKATGKSPLNNTHLASYANKKMPSTLYKEFAECENIRLADFILFKGSTILCVEDNIINQKILLSILKRSGITITIANHGKEALEILKAKQGRFDLILMDIAMPVMDGYTATKLIRENRAYDTIPLMTFTAFTHGEEINKMFSLGANAFITKPLHTGQLFSAFSAFLPREQRGVSLAEELKINGLDIEHGMAFSENDKEKYKDALFDFVLHYKETIHALPKWIDQCDAKRIMKTCSQMGIALNHLGAYELEELVFKMKKVYLYRMEHRIDIYKDEFPVKLDKLVNNIEKYLKAG